MKEIDKYVDSMAVKGEAITEKERSEQSCRIAELEKEILNKELTFDIYIDRLKEKIESQAHRISELEEFLKRSRENFQLLEEGTDEKIESQSRLLDKQEKMIKELVEALEYCTYEDHGKRHCSFIDSMDLKPVTAALQSAAELEKETK